MSPGASRMFSSYCTKFILLSQRHVLLNCSGDVILFHASFCVDFFSVYLNVVQHETTSCQLNKYFLFILVSAGLR